MRCFDVTLNGFDGESDETDHLVKWVSAPSYAALQKFITRSNLEGSVLTMHDMGDLRSKYGPEDGVDVIVGDDGRIEWPTFGDARISEWKLESA